MTARKRTSPPNNHLRNLPKVCASRARRPSLPPLAAAALSVLAGIRFPAGTPNCRCNAPGRRIADLIQFAMRSSIGQINRAVNHDLSCTVTPSE